MVLTSDQERIRLLLSDTVMLLCKNGLCFQSKFSVDAVIGITLDDSDVFLVNIRETVGLDIQGKGSLVQGNVDRYETGQRDTVCEESGQKNTSGAEEILRNTSDEKTGHQRDTDFLFALYSEAQMKQSNESLLSTPNGLNIASNNFPSAASSVLLDHPNTQRMLSSNMSSNTVKSNRNSSINRSSDTDEGRPLKIIRLTDIRSDVFHEVADTNDDSRSCEVTIKSEPSEEQSVQFENRLSIANEVRNSGTNVMNSVSNKSKPYKVRLFESFGGSAASRNCLNLFRDRPSTKCNIISTANVRQHILSSNVVEKSAPLNRSSTSSNCLNLSRDSSAANDLNLTATVGCSRQILLHNLSEKSRPSVWSDLSQDENEIPVADDCTSSVAATVDSSRQILLKNHSEKSRPSIWSGLSPDENEIPVADDSTSSDHSVKDQSQQWSTSYTDSCLKSPWGDGDASDNLRSVKNLKYFSEDFKPALDLYRPSLDWVPSMKNIFSRQPFNYPQIEDAILQLPEHVARDCIQTILLYDGRYVPVRDIQRLRLCGQSSGMIRTAMLMLDDLHHGGLGFYRELPTGVALLYKCPPERVDAEKLQSYGISLDVYHMRYYTLPSFNATTRHCDGYWQRIESYSPYV